MVWSVQIKLKQLLEPCYNLFPAYMTWNMCPMTSVTRWLVWTVVPLLLKGPDVAATPGPWFNIKMSSYQYRNSHCGDKTILRPSYLHNGIPYTGKMTSLYWIRVQIPKSDKPPGGQDSVTSGDEGAESSMPYVTRCGRVVKLVTRMDI